MAFAKLPLPFTNPVGPVENTMTEPSPKSRRASVIFSASRSRASSQLMRSNSCVPRAEPSTRSMG